MEDTHMYTRNSLLDKLPQILFTVLGLIIIWAILGAAQDITTVLSNILGI